MQYEHQSVTGYCEQLPDAKGHARPTALEKEERYNTDFTMKQAYKTLAHI